MCKVYTGCCGTSEIEHGLCACTVDDPLAKARGLSLRTGAQTMLYLSLVDTPDNAAEIMNTDLHSIYRRSEEWLVDFNASKTFTMTVSRKLNPLLLPPLFFNAT